MTNGPDRRRRERRDLRFQLWVAALALLAGVGAGIVGEPRVSSAGAPRESDETPTTTSAPSPDEPGEPVATRVPSPRTLLLGHLGPDGRLDLLVAVAVAEGHEVGEALLIPTATLVEVPSLETQALADVVRLGSLGGPDLLHTAIENALGTAFDGMLLTDDVGLISLLAPAGAVTVDFGRAFRVDDDAGTLAFTAGSQEIDAATAVRLLVGLGEQGELDHLVTVQAVMKGWLAELGDRDVAAATVSADPAARSLVIAARAAVRYDTLPVVSVASGGEERFAIRRDDARSLLERTMPWALLGDEPRPRVEILNGTGEVGVTQSVAKAIVREGAEVTLTGNLPGFGAEATQVVYYRDEQAGTAQALAAALGYGDVVKAPRPVDVIDVTIVVGADLAEAQSRVQGPDHE